MAAVVVTPRLAAREVGILGQVARVQVKRVHPAASRVVLAVLPPALPLAPPLAPPLALAPLAPARRAISHHPVRRLFELKRQSGEEVIR